MRVKTKQRTLSAPASSTPALLEWKKKYEAFKLVRDEEQMVRSLYLAYFDRIPTGYSTAMLSLKLEYYLWQKSMAPEDWAMKSPQVHQNYAAAQALNLRGLSKSLQDIVEINLKESETQMAKTKARTKATTSNAATHTNGNAPTSTPKVRTRVFGNKINLGKVKGLNFKESWHHYLLLPKTPDSRILELMEKEFPGKKTVTQGTLTAYRQWYNKGGYNNNIIPKLLSFPYAPERGLPGPADLDKVDLSKVVTTTRSKVTVKAKTNSKQ